MPFYFADQEVLAKQPAHGFLPKPLIAKIERLMEKPAMSATPAFHLIMEHH